jgi:hypothetical protein
MVAWSAAQTDASRYQLSCLGMYRNFDGHDADLPMNVNRSAEVKPSTIILQWWPRKACASSRTVIKLAESHLPEASLHAGAAGHAPR